LPIEPCFKVQKIDYRSFRGSVSGLGFAYCDFYQHNPRAQLISRAPAPAPVPAAQLTSRVPAPVPVRPMPMATLRPAIEE
jgi:hypothetical protein